MLSSLGSLLGIDMKPGERLKFLFLTIAFMLVIGSYTIAKELKDSIFVNIVGQEYLPKAKVLVIFVLIPLALLYAYMVDRLRRYQVISFYCLAYGLVMLVFAWLLGHPTIGLPNTDTDKYRIFGWLFFFILEGFSPYVVGVFWAFANSVTSPDEAKRNYAIMVSGSKLGGIATSLFAWYMLSNLNVSLWFNFSDVFAHQILLLIVAFMLLLIPVTIYFMMKMVPGRYLHGYEAVYQLEKKKSKKGEASTGMLSGLKMMLSSPYILGIFGLIFFYESLNVVLNFQRILLLKAASKSIAGFTASMFLQRFYMHLAGLFVSFFGARFLIRRLGERLSLMLVPCIITVLLIYFISSYSPTAILNVFIILGTVNYSLSYQLRETLYIPTTKDIKFKSKSWIDSFGTKFSKSFGSVFNDVSQFIAQPGTAAFTMVYTVFFSGIVLLWFITSFLLGWRYENAVTSGKVIGLEKDS